MNRTAFLAALLALLVAAFWFKGGLVEPAPVPERAAAGEFDARRALARLQRILGDETPHPVDSAGADAVRGRLIAELKALGLQPTVTDDFTCNGSQRNRVVTCARIRNLLARIGPPQGRPVMMVSHYDSTAVGPGAGDDGIGIAVMLEAAALLKDRPLNRPVLLLFNEGEEAGLIGARAFLERNPLARQVESIINLEARGVTGPAAMFETSRPNGPAMAAYAASVPRPSANSMMVDFYEMLPNDTDVSVFLERPYTILNLAIVGNETRYHSPGDVIAALDPKSVRHMGDQALAATAEFAAVGGAAGAGERLYTDVLGSFLVSMPKWLGLALLGTLCLLFGRLAWSRRGGAARAAATVALALADAAIAVFLGQWLVGLLRDGEWWRAYPEVTALAVYLTALAAGIAALLVLARPLARDRLRLGYWLFFLIFGLGVSFVAPGGAIFFLLPPLVVGAAMLARRWERPAALIAWALLFLSWAPLLHMSETLLDMDAAWAFAPVAVIIMMPLLIELMPLIRRVSPALLAGATVAASVLGWIAAGLTPAYSQDRKQIFGIEYVWDQRERRSSWMVVNDGAPLPTGFFGFDKNVEVPFSGRRRWAAPARRQPVEPPAMEKLAERRGTAGRLLTLRLRSNGAQAVTLRAKPEADFRAVRAAGFTRRFGSGGAQDDFVLRCQGRSCDGVQIELLVGRGKPVEATIIGSRPGLPAAARPLVSARQPLAQPQYSPDATIAYARVKL